MKVGRGSTRVATKKDFLRGQAWAQRLCRSAAKFMTVHGMRAALRRDNLAVIQSPDFAR
jgi:hypothetical protein